MRLIVQQCSNKQSCSSHIFAYVKERYTNVIWCWMAIIFYAFYTTLQIKCTHDYKQRKDKKTINRET